MANQQYNTLWSEIDVSCEACHGPASEHLVWAENYSNRSDSNQPIEKSSALVKGFSITFDERIDAGWVMDVEVGIAKRTSPKTTHKEIETCAACHSRRTTAHPDAKPGDDFLDNFQLSLLDQNLYHVDGQPEGEVYVYGSFLQSKMYHAGVTCSDCHQPHSLELKAPGNQVCTQCHLTTVFETTEHHLHIDESPGAKCVNCHMPEKNFMVVDARRDHSFRVPRPDLSVALGVPNACMDCHQDKTSEWAAEKLRARFGEKDRQHFAFAFSAAIQGLPQAEQLLSQIILDDTQPALVRATAVSLLPNYLSQQSAPVLQMVAQSNEPLLGLGLAQVANQIPEQYRPVFAIPLLYDDSRITKAFAAQSLVGLSLDQYPQEVKDKYQQGLDYLIQSNQFNADRPESLTNLGNYYVKQGLNVQAKGYFQKAIDMAHYYTPAHINLAEVLRREGDESASRDILRKGLDQVRDISVINHSLGLSFVRTNEMDDALEHLKLATQASDAPARYHYVYAVALESEGDIMGALSVLKLAEEKFPNDVAVISALVAYSEKNGDSEMAKKYQERLESIY